LLQRTLTQRLSAVSCAILCSAGVATAAAAQSSYTIGNLTPTTIFSVRGQSFTPNVLGNAGVGPLVTSGTGTVFLTSFFIDFAPVQTQPTPTKLYVYSALPTLANSATGVGALGTGVYQGGGLFSFLMPLELNAATKYFAVLPASYNIFDGAGNTYTGGGDLFNGESSVVEGGFDIGFRAQFSATTVPEPSTYAMMLVGIAAVGLASRRRRQLN